MSTNASIVTQDGVTFITVLIDGNLYSAASDHPNFRAIMDALADGEDITADLFDVGAVIVKGFEDGPLSARVSVQDDTIYLDGEPVENTLTDQVLRFLDEGVDDWKPLVRFIEKIEANTNDHTRQQLYNWLDANKGFTITPEGNVVGYKGVRKTDDGQYVSITRGPAIVNGDPVNGAVPNNPGSVVEMAREQVEHNPARGCSTGLHVGTFGYASGFAQGAVLEVEFDPSDVVSVPTDCGAQKLRTCRYKVIKVIDAAYTTALRPDEADEDDLDGDYGDPDLWV